MALTFAAFAVNISETQDRLAYSVTLLLTSIAFKYVVTQNLPTISYLTVLVSINLLCFMLDTISSFKKRYLKSTL